MPRSSMNDYAVFIGTDVPVTPDDGPSTTSLLQDAARRVCSSSQVHRLTGENAHRDHISTALARLAEQAQGDLETTAVVSFSGHTLETLGHLIKNNRHIEGQMAGLERKLWLH